MYKKHEIIEEKMCKELEMIEDKYKGGAELAEADLRKVDMLVHALKSLATYEAMKEASEMQSYAMGNSNGNSYNNSYARGRDSMGRYTSRDMGPDMSGYYPPHPYPERW